MAEEDANSSLTEAAPPSAVFAVVSDLYKYHIECCLCSPLTTAFNKNPLALPLTSGKPGLERVERNRCGEVGEQPWVEVAGAGRDEGRQLCGPVGAVRPRVMVAEETKGQDSPEEPLSAVHMQWETVPNLRKLKKKKKRE